MVAALFKVATNPLCLVDETGVVILTNEAFGALSGLNGADRTPLGPHLTHLGTKALALALRGTDSDIGPQATHPFDTTKSWVAKATPVVTARGVQVLLAAEAVEGARDSDSELSWRRLTYSSLKSEALATAMDYLPIGVVLVEIRDGDPPASVAYNEAYAKMLGIASEGARIPTLYSPDGHAVAIEDFPGARAARTGEAVRDVLLHARTHDGELRTLSISASPIVGGAKVRRAVAVLNDVTARVRAEEAQRKSDLRCGTVFESFRDALAVFEAVPGENGIEWFYREANSALLLSLGMRRDDIVGKSFTKLFPAIAEKCHPWMTAVLAAGNVHETETVWGDSTFLVRFFSVGPNEVVITSLDITSAKRDAESLRRTTERFEATASTVPGVLYDYVVDGEGPGELIYLSPGASRLFELPVDEILSDANRVWSMLLPQDVQDLHRATSQGGGAVDAWAVTPSGAQKCLRFTWRENPNPSDATVRGSGFILDVTEASRARLDLARSQKELFALIETLPIGVFVAREGKILYSNPELGRSFGCAPSELAGKDTTEVFAIDPDGSGPFPATGNAFAERTEWAYKRANGSQVLLETSSSREVAIEGRPASLVTVRDLTELRSMRAQLMQSDRLASLGMLAAGVAHEINNPLAYVVAALELMEETLGRENLAVQDLATSLAEAREGTARVRQVVRDLKSFSKAAPERAVPVDLHSVLDSSASMASNEIRHRAQLVKMYGPVPPVSANEARLGQVFLNLLINAAQAIPEGQAARNEIRIVTFTRGDGSAVVEVRDTGGGIPEGALSRIFDPFFTTKPFGIGTGLGLAICKTTVEALGGRIEVENDPARGAVFRVTLSPSLGEIAVVKPFRSTRPKGRRGRVLVVDDEPTIGHAIGRVLGTEHEVTCVTSARDALHRCAAGERFDVVLCDLMMPDLNGMDLHAAVLDLDAAQAERFVFLTGGAFTDRAASFLERSTNPCVEKPYDSKSLKALVRDLVGA